MRCWVEVSLGSIRANYRAVRDLVGTGVAVMPVVKADAYRHGAPEVSRALEDEGAKWLAVSNVEEGVALRQEGIRTNILVMADFPSDDPQAFAQYQLTPVVQSLEDIRQAHVPYHLKIDTGMGRLGAREDATRVVDAIRSGTAPLQGVMTHFASSANYTSRQTEDQQARFARVLAGLHSAGIEPRYIHESSTIPIAYQRREAWGNLVRPGHAIYGYVSPARGTVQKSALKVRPALAWKTRVLSVKTVEEGALVGYGGIYCATRPTRIAVLAAGYADGIPHRLSNRGQVLACGKALPIIGAISMDLTTIDVTECPQLAPGDTVTLLGNDAELSIDAQQMAKTAGSISYAVLCGISARVRRVYVD